MKTVVICFKKRTCNTNLALESSFVKFLNFNALYADQIKILSTADKSGFNEAFSQKWDCLFILNSKNAEFCLSDVLSENGYSIDGAGFCVESGLISLVPEKFDDDYAEGLRAALNKKYGFFAENVCFKLYDVDFSKLDGFCRGLNEKYPQCHFHADEEGGDVKVVLTYGENASKTKVDRAIKEFIKAFKDYIYAEDDITLEERLNQVLRLRNLKACTAESMTGGLIAAKIVSVSGASDIFYEGLTTYDTLAKERRLGVNHSTVVKHTVVSAPIAYEMAAGLLDGGNCSVAICITGYAGSDVHPAKDDGQCFIGIGVKDKIKVFEYNFDGARKENIQKAANAALFLAIKTVEELDGFNPYA